MRKRLTLPITLMALIGFGAWFWIGHYDSMFTIPRLHKPLLDGLPEGAAGAAGTHAFRNEYIAASGALCGEIRGVSGGDRFAPLGDPGRVSGIVPMLSSSWRRFIVAPAVPAFYIEGLAPWALSLDGKRIKVDQLDLDDETDAYQQQYALATVDAGRDPASVRREIGLKVLEEHFEVQWGDDCDRPR